MCKLHANKLLYIDLKTTKTTLNRIVAFRNASKVRIRQNFGALGKTLATLEKYYKLLEKVLEKKHFANTQYDVCFESE